jgi:hypothetical protein
MAFRDAGMIPFLDSFPDKPRGMHWRTYYRLFSKAAAVQERSIALEREDMRRRFPGVHVLRPRGARAPRR